MAFEKNRTLTDMERTRGARLKGVQLEFGSVDGIESRAGEVGFEFFGFRARLKGVQ